MKLNSDSRQFLNGQLITQQVALEMVGDKDSYQNKVLLLLCLCIGVISFHVTGQSYSFILPPLLCDGIPCPQKDYCSDQPITVDREDGYKYHNLITQFDLWCSRATLGTVAQSTYFLGSILGGTVMSYLADRIGRRKAYLISWGFVVISSIFILFSASIYQYIVANFFMGFGGMPCYILNYVILNEMSGSAFRQKASVMTLIAWSVSEIFTAAMYYLIPSWWECFAAFVAIPACILFFCLFWMKETPQYYLSKRMFPEYYKVLDDIAVVNTKPTFTELMPKIQDNLADNLRDTFVTIEVAKNKQYNLVDLFRFKSLRNASLGFMVISFTLHLVYYGGQYSISDITTGNDVYIMGAVMGLAELSAYFSVKQFIHLLPRRMSLIVSYALQIGSCALFLIFGWSSTSTQTTSETSPKAISIIVIACLIRIFNSVGFAFQGLYSNEVYPTCVRALGSGFLFSVGVAGSFLSPYTIEIADILKVNPYLIIGLLCVSGPFATLLVPETLGKPLKDKIEEERNTDTEIDLRESRTTNA